MIKENTNKIEKDDKYDKDDEEKIKRIIVVDIDETLIFTSQLRLLWIILNEYLKKVYILNNIDFYNLLELYPEFIRPNILFILQYLKNKKQKKYCDKVIIYTNNQHGVEWIKNIKFYFEKKINYKLFDKTINAYKINNIIIENNRSTKQKSYKDLLNCLNIKKKDIKFCYIDDKYFKDMDNENIYYIKVEPYIFELSLDEMIKRFTKSIHFNELLKNNKQEITTKIIDKLILYKYRNIDNKDFQYHNEKFKKLYHYLKKFFKLTFFNSLKKNNIKKNKTQKKKYIII